MTSMTSNFDYDVLVIGAGQGGLPAAHMAANLQGRRGCQDGPLT